LLTTILLRSLLMFYLLRRSAAARIPGTKRENKRTQFCQRLLRLCHRHITAIGTGLA
jgi:hypothetical protein